MRPAAPGLALVVAALLALTAGCGPGVGGTGTGEGAVPEHRPTALCAAPFAAALACPATREPSADGTAPVRFADTPADPRVTLLFEANGVQLDAPCAKLVFSGRWGESPDGVERFYGTLRVDGRAFGGSLAVTADDAALRLQPFDADGRVVAALPAVLRAEAAGGARCP